MVSETRKTLQKLIFIVLLAVMAFLAYPQFASAEVVPFADIPPQGSGTGQGRSELAPRGFGVELDGTCYWLQSEYDNTNFCAIYSGKTNGYDKPLPVYDSNNQLIEYTFYAYVDRNPEFAEGYIALYKDGEKVDLTGKTGTPVRTYEIKDPSGQSYRWQIPITLTLEEGCRYEFAFLRGIKAHNGVTGVIDEEGTGYLKEPFSSEEEKAWYEAHKNDEYQYREYLYSTYIPSEEASEPPYMRMDMNDPNPTAGTFHEMRFRFSTTGDVNPDELSGNEYEGLQGKGWQLTMRDPSASKIQTVRENDTNIANKILTTQKHTDDITFSFSLKDDTQTLDESFLKSQVESSVKVMDRNRKTVFADSENGNLLFRSYNEQDSNKVTISISNNTLAENKWYALVFESGIKASESGQELGQTILFYFKTKDLSGETGTSVNVHLTEDDAGLQAAVDNSLGEEESYENIGMLKISTEGNRQITGEECLFIRETLTNLASLDMSGAKIQDGALPDEGLKNLVRLKECRLPENITVIGKSAFEGCKVLKEIEFPYTINSIGDRAFCGCEALTGTVTMNSSDAPAIGPDTFRGTGITKFMLPDGSYQKYYGTEYWSQLPIRERRSQVSFTVKIPDGSEAVGAQVFLREEEQTDNSQRREYSVTADEKGKAVFQHLTDGNFTVYIQWGDYAVASRTLELKGQTWDYEVTLKEKQTVSVTLPDDGASLKEALAQYVDSQDAFAGVSTIASLTITTKNSYVLTREDLSYVGYDQGYASLQYLDLSGAELEKGIFPGGTERKQGPFTSMSRLETVKLSSSVTSIDDYAFSQCTDLKNVIIPQTSQLESIGDYAFYQCSSLTGVDFLPEKALAFGESVFEGCSGLKEVTIPASWKSLSGGMFRNCENLESVIFKENSQLIEVGHSCFESCGMLTEIQLPDPVTDIGNGAFKRSGIKSFDFTELPKVEAIPAELFSQCTSLQKVTIKDGMDTIGEDAFYRTNIQSITIPASISEIQSGTFAYCQNLSDVVLCGENVEVGDGAFRSTALIDIPENLKADWTGEHVFAGCNQLEDITFPRGMTAIPPYTFQNCTGRYFQTDLAGIRTIGQNAFEGSSVWVTEIPASVQNIADSAFKRCTGLGESGTLYVNSKEPPKLGKTVFRNTGISKIAVPYTSLEAYKAAENWSTISTDNITLAPQEQVTLSASAATVEIGSTMKLTAKVLPEGSVTWESSDSRIASISEDGTIKALRIGSVNVTATTLGEGRKAVCRLTVRNVLAPKASAASAGYNQIKVTWSGVSGAKGYILCRCSKSGVIQKSWTVGASTRSFTDTGRSTGTAYYYKVQAYKTVDGTNHRGTYSALVSAKPVPAKVSSVKAARGGAQKIKVTWRRTSGASGYTVASSTKASSGYKTVGTIKSGGTVKYVTGKLKKGKRYYFKVRAYRTVKGKKIYGSYSSAVSYKAK